MRDLEPDYKKEYEELIKKLDFFAEIVTLAGVVCVAAFMLSLIVRNI